MVDGVVGEGVGNLMAGQWQGALNFGKFGKKSDSSEQEGLAFPLFREEQQSCGKKFNPSE